MDVDQQFVSRFRIIVEVKGDDERKRKVRWSKKKNVVLYSSKAPYVFSLHRCKM